MKNSCTMASTFLSYMMILQNKQLLTVSFHYYCAVLQDVKHTQGMYSTCTAAFLSVLQS
ncbi:Uncharacterised protein [Mycobacteroides abscessus subsp. abscessus]|nr:Uncharacterised protein [Mycobacteroides abscessus subsp. abscessus]